MQAKASTQPMKPEAIIAVDGYLIYYNIPENVAELLPALEFAYKKHSGN